MRRLGAQAIQKRLSTSKRQVRRYLMESQRMVRYARRRPYRAVLRKRPEVPAVERPRPSAL